MPSRSSPTLRLGRVRAAAIALTVLGCSDGTGTGDPLAGTYPMSAVHFADALLQPVPAVHVAGTDTTVVEGGSVVLSDGTRCALELRYRWRYAGVPGGDTVAETLTYTYDTTAAFGVDGQVQWYRLLRAGEHVAYLLRRRDGTLILDSYDHAGTVNFYFAP